MKKRIQNSEGLVDPMILCVAYNGVKLSVVGYEINSLLSFCVEVFF